MAKTKTPAPPKRPVQAPKRRDTRRSSGLGGPGWLWGLVAGLVVAGIAIGVFFAVHKSSGSSSASSSTGNATQGALPGLQKTPAPWQPEYANLSFRLNQMGFPILNGMQEQLTYHVHQHLDIYVNGKKERVPQYIGIDPGSNYLTQIHTHDASGVIHVEADKDRHFTLGQVFDVWGVRFTKSCLGSYCNDVKAYLDGKPWTGNPRSVPLKDHEEIAVVVGKPPKTIPKSWPFGKNGL